MSAFFASFAVGVAVAAPVGPVGLLCIQRTLRGGVPFGVASGLGVATADGLYAALATLGLAAVATLARDLAAPLQAAGGVVLVALAWRAWPHAREACGAAPAATASGLARAYASTLALTLANPTTILSFAAIMAGLGAGLADPGAGPVFVAGVALGSLAWWVVLALAVGWARERAPERFIVWAGRVSSVILVAAGLSALLAAARLLL